MATGRVVDVARSAARRVPATAIAVFTPRDSLPSLPSITRAIFVDTQEGPVGEWHRQEAIWQDFCQLPEEVQQFVVKPINIKYLEVAMKLAKMPAGSLRAIAEGLLDITY